MTIKLGPLQVAAIASAGVAISLISFVVIYRLFRRSTRNRPSPSTHRGSPSSSTRPLSPSRTNAESFTAFNLGHGQTATVLPKTQTPITPSSSTRQTTVATPSTSDRMEYGKRTLNRGAGGRSPAEPEADRPESEELVVVTYEDGLRKLGIDPDGDRPRQHHILYPEDDDDPEAMAAYDYERQQVQVRAADSPRATPGRRGGGGGGNGGARGQARNALESTWLPSYYHSAQSGRGGERSDGTELGLGYRVRI